MNNIILKIDRELSSWEWERKGKWEWKWEEEKGKEIEGKWIPLPWSSKGPTTPNLAKYCRVSMKCSKSKIYQIF